MARGKEASGSSTHTTPTLASVTDHWPGQPPRPFLDNRTDSIPLQGRHHVRITESPASIKERPSFSGPPPLFRRQSTTFKSLDDPDRAPHGYPRLAHFMAHEPGAAIYRRFGSLNARIGLYRQAEIMHLEHELDALEQTAGAEGVGDLHHSVRELMHAEPGTTAARLWAKVLEIEGALERYNASLLQQKRLFELPEADHGDCNDLNNFVYNEVAMKAPLKFPENMVWWCEEKKGRFGLNSYKAEQKDLVRLSGDGRFKDPFTKFLWGPMLDLVYFFDRHIRGPKDETGVYDYSNSTFNGVAKVTSMGMASLLPTLSIVALYFIHNDVWRLIFIVIFSAVFTMSLTIFTAASRIEIFLASVGLASVQAVFVGNLIVGDRNTG